MKFDRKRDPRRYPRDHPKENSQPRSVSNPKYHRVRNRSAQQSQRPVFAAQQIVREIKRPQYVQTRARDAHARDYMVIDRMHRTIVGATPFTAKTLRLPPPGRFFYLALECLHTWLNQDSLPFAL
jgi:hypothetical protein